jgi:hypothetical protein
MYFPQLQNEATQDWDIAWSSFEGTYQPIEFLDTAVNSSAAEFAPFVSPDGDYLIFSSSRPGGYGRSDLWICFADDDGVWGEAQNLGPQVNTAWDDSYPSVSPDGDYLFFVGPGPADYVYYWISASVIEELRPTCCSGASGNVDNDESGMVDIGDLTALIGYLYIPPNPEPACLEEANIDGVGDVDIGDLTALIAYLYIPPNPPPSSCT